MILAAGCTSCDTVFNSVKSKELQQLRGRGVRKGILIRSEGANRVGPRSSVIKGLKLHQDVQLCAKWLVHVAVDDTSSSCFEPDMTNELLAVLEGAPAALAAFQDASVGTSLATLPPPPGVPTVLPLPPQDLQSVVAPTFGSPLLLPAPPACEIKRAGSAPCEDAAATRTDAQARPSYDQLEDRVRALEKWIYDEVEPRLCLCEARGASPSSIADRVLEVLQNAEEPLERQKVWSLVIRSYSDETLTEGAISKALYALRSNGRVSRHTKDGSFMWIAGGCHPLCAEADEDEQHATIRRGSKRARASSAM